MLKKTGSILLVSMTLSSVCFAHSLFADESTATQVYRDVNSISSDSKSNASDAAAATATTNTTSNAVYNSPTPTDSQISYTPPTI